MPTYEEEPDMSFDNEGQDYGDDFESEGEL